METLLDEHAALLTAGERVGGRAEWIRREGKSGRDDSWPSTRSPSGRRNSGRRRSLPSSATGSGGRLGIGVVLTGGAAGPLDRIRARMKTEAVNLGGRTTLRELACLYRQAALVITTDSGPMHLAAAVGTPVVALFGPTDPARTGPYGPGHRVIRRGLACMPCFRKRCETRAMHAGDRRGRGFCGCRRKYWRGIRKE